MTTAKEYAKLTESEQKKEDWMNAKWRPMMGWTYMITCVADFILFPILWSILQAALKQPVTAWQPITLQGAGLYHLAMGAIIGVAAFGRTQEKLAGANNGGMQPLGQSVTTTYGSPSAGGFGASNSFSSPTSNSFGSSSGFGAPTSNSFGATSRPATGKSARFAEADPDSVFDRG
jgi:hypothetical protein